MALVTADRVKESTTTAGTGTVTLAGAIAGFQSFAAVGNANKCDYLLVDGNNWEVGRGTYTSSGTTLSRDTVRVSLISGVPGTSKISLSGGTTIVSLIHPGIRDTGFQLGSITKFTSHASGTYNTPAGCNLLEVTLVGAGAGGGGVAQSIASNSAVATGGAGGGTCYAWIFNPLSSYAYVVGTGGPGGVAGANDGTDGTASTFGASFLTAGGGGHGVKGVDGTTLAWSASAAVGGTATGGDLNYAGTPSGPWMRHGIGSTYCSCGGASQYAPTNSLITQLVKGTAVGGIAGINATMPGGGGGGAVSVTASGGAFKGGDGFDGLLLIKEYY